ncbi:hypothetical protein Tco_0389919 [Tanacetum coccineum]
MSEKASNTFDISTGGSFKITSIFALSTSRRNRVLQEYIFQSLSWKGLSSRSLGVLREDGIDLIISIDGDIYSNGGSSVSIQSSRVFIRQSFAMNSSKFSKEFLHREGFTTSCEYGIHMLIARLWWLVGLWNYVLLGLVECYWEEI